LDAACFQHAKQAAERSLLPGVRLISVEPTDDDDGTAGTTAKLPIKPKPPSFSAEAEFPPDEEPGRYREI
jgi:hypothetical protein